MEKSAIKKIATYAVIFLLFYLEIAVFDKLRIFGVRPELLLIATFFFGFHFGILRGMEAGIVSGLLKDIFSLSSFGINTFSFLLMGFVSGFLKNKLVRENFITQFFLAALSVLVISVVYFLYLNQIVKSAISREFWKASLYKGLYTGCMAPFLFFILTRIFGPKEPR